MFRSLYRSIISIQIAVIVLRIYIRQVSRESEHTLQTTLFVYAHERTYLTSENERTYTFLITLCVYTSVKETLSGEKNLNDGQCDTMELWEDCRCNLVTGFRFFIFNSRLTSGINWGMLCYYNVYVSKDRGMFSRFPEHHWVALSMIYAFYRTTVFQFGV